MYGPWAPREHSGFDPDLDRIVGKRINFQQLNDEDDLGVLKGLGAKQWVSVGKQRTCESAPVFRDDPTPVGLGFPLL